MAKKKQDEEITENQETPVEVNATDAAAESPEAVEAVEAADTAVETAPAEAGAEETGTETETQTEQTETEAETVTAGAPQTESAAAGEATPARKGERGNRAQKVGTVKSDKMQKTCVVRVDRLVKHPIYRRYVRRRTNFMAHNEVGAATGDRVRIVETRPLSARKRWRVVEIIQKAEK